MLNININDQARRETVPLAQQLLTAMRDDFRRAFRLQQIMSLGANPHASVSLQERVDSIPTAFAVLNSDSRICYSNPEAEDYISSMNLFSGGKFSALNAVNDPNDAFAGAIHSLFLQNAASANVQIADISGRQKFDCLFIRLDDDMQSMLHGSDRAIKYHQLIGLFLLPRGWFHPAYRDKWHLEWLARGVKSAVIGRDLPNFSDEYRRDLRQRLFHAGPQSAANQN